MVGRPSGAVTFLFTDVEGSTRAWEDDPTGMSAALETHDRVIRAAVESHRGFVFSTAGDSFSVAFSSPSDALSAAAEAQRSLAASGGGLRVRMGVHSGEAVERDGQYFGPPLNRTARLMALGHGGQILISDITAGLVTGTDFEFADLGEHRLADLAAPVRVFQLVADGLDGDFPPLRSAVATGNLPRLGEVFGRASDIDRLSQLFDRHRLVTLTGAGGIGKTTLAISVAAGTGDLFPDGTWLVDLTDLPQGSDGTAIAGAVAGVDDRFSGMEALAPRRMLLILDNCEHVLDAARSYLHDLSADAANVTVLATSREPLGLREERVVPVEPLSVDENSDHASAVDLFIARAEQAGVSLDLDAERETITQICRAVGGLPLAIELAAARTTVMTPTQILDRLSDRLTTLRGGRDGPEHHRTIEATIAWSYDLLDPDTQRLLRFLSVFEGGFDLEQTEAVGGDQAVDQLADLTRKNLVQRHDDRFGMLEAVRQYAAARLHETGEEDEARRRHFEFFADWAQHIYHRDEYIRTTVDELHWMTANLANLQAAVRYGTKTSDHAAATAETAVVLGRHWIAVMLGKPPPDDFYQPLVERTDELEPPLQMAVLMGSGMINDWQGNRDTARQRFLSAYEVHARTEQLPRTSTQPQVSLGIHAYISGEWEEAERWYRDAIEFADRHNLPHHNASHNLAELLRDVHDDPDGALAVLSEARRHEHAPETLLLQQKLEEADTRLRMGETEHPRELVTESLTRLRTDRIMIYQQAWSLILLSVIEYREGKTRDAVTLLREALELEATEGMAWRIWHHPEALYLGEVLIGMGEVEIASRVLDEYEADPSVTPPVHMQRLGSLRQELSAQPRSHTGSTVIRESDLSDAVIRALEADHL